MPGEDRKFWFIVELGRRDISGTGSRGGSWKVSGYPYLFSMEEWEYLGGHNELYRNIKVENQSPRTSPDGSSNRYPPESPRPLYSPDSTQEDHTIPHQDQGEELKYIKAEIKTEEEETFVSGAQQSTEEGEMMMRSKQEESSLHMDTNGSRNRNPPKRHLRLLLPRISIPDDHTIPHHDQDEEFKYIKAEIKEEEEEEETFVGGAQQFMEEGEMIMRGEQETTSLHIDTRMMASKFTSPGFLPHFISMYRSLTCLWKIKSKEYFDRSKRNEAYAKLAELCKRVYAKADIVYVKSKIANLRTVFKKELNKICASKKSGSDEVYVPRLWYFESLRFLDDEDEPKRSASAAHPSSSQPSSTSPVPDTDSQEETTETQDNFIRHSPTPPLPAASTHKGTKRKGSEKVFSKFYCDASAALHQQSDECSIFGRLAASKLRRMSTEQRQIVEPLIYQLLNKGLRGDATLNTHIAEYSKSNAPPSQQVPQISHFCRFPNARP